MANPAVDEIVEKRRNAANKRWGKNKNTDLPFPVEEQGEVEDEVLFNSQWEKLEDTRIPFIKRIERR